MQALSGYALAAFRTKSAKSSEAGLKYFILGALMSGLMLLGISFLYGYSGSIKFIEIKQQFAADVVDITNEDDIDIYQELLATRSCGFPNQPLFLPHKIDKHYKPHPDQDKDLV